MMHTPCRHFEEVVAQVYYSKITEAQREKILEKVRHLARGHGLEVTPRDHDENSHNNECSTQFVTEK